MTFWEKVTGNDITKEFKSFEDRAKKLPADYQEAWVKIKENLWQHSNFTGRNVMPIIENALVILEETALDGKSIEDVLGYDIKGFCSELVGEDSNSFRDKWRKQLNNNIAKKLGK